MNEQELENRRILIIDDTESVHGDIKKVLQGGSDSQDLDAVSAKILSKEDSQEEGAPVGGMRFEIDSAYQGEEGVRMIEEALRGGEPYAMAFVDMRMPPGWDGVETIERIWGVDGNIQVVICTAYSDYSWQEMVQRLGVTDRMLVLKKPFDSIEVFQVACAMTEKWRLAHLHQLQTFRLLKRRSA